MADIEQRVQMLIRCGETVGNQQNAATEKLPTVSCSSGAGMAFLGTDTAGCMARNEAEGGKLVAETPEALSNVLAHGIFSGELASDWFQLEHFNHTSHSPFRSWQPELVSSSGKIPRDRNHRLLRISSYLSERARNSSSGSPEYGGGSGSRRRFGRPPEDLGMKHVIYERKRRRREAEGFEMLSRLLPNLTKKDTVSVLVGALDYIKELKMEHERLQKTKLAMEEVLTMADDN